MSTTTNKEFIAYSQPLITQEDVPVTMQTEDGTELFVTPADIQEHEANRQRIVRTFMGRVAVAGVGHVITHGIQSSKCNEKNGSVAFIVARAPQSQESAD